MNESGKITFTTIAMTLLVVLILTIGCSGSSSPTQPSVSGADISTAAIHTGSSVVNNRYLLGYWRVNIDTDTLDIQITPDRSTEMHLNCVRLLEVTPCTNCLSIANLQLLPDIVIQGDLVLKHPYSTGNLKLSGFDVRGIFIGEADYTWPVSGRKLAVGDDVPRMLNPDGYTSLFNPTEFPQTNPPALGYIVGNYTFGGDLTATLNPFIAFNKDKPRRLFRFAETATETIRIKFPEGPLEFGYAIDGCWQTFPGPCVDPVVDFPPDANSLEAYQVTTWGGPGLSLDPGAWSYVYATVYDHQGQDTIAQVSAEIPEVVSGPIIMDFYDDRADGGFVYRGKVTNELDAPTGDYPFLVRVLDTESDQNLGQIDAWSPGTFPIRNGWVMFWGGEIEYGNTDASEVAISGSDDIYIMGAGREGMDYDPTPGEEIPGVNQRNYISKYDWGGGLEWVGTWGINVNINTAGDIAVDPDGNVYFVGNFTETVDFDPTSGVEERTSFSYIDSDGDEHWCYDMFLLKLNSSGEFVWVVTWPDDARIRPIAVEVDGASSVLIAGIYWGTMDFDPGDGVNEYTKDDEQYDAFLVKLDTNGNYSWAKAWTCDNWIRTNDVTADHAGNVIVSGTFDGVTDMDPGPGEDIHDSENLENCYFSKFSTDGGFLWSNSLTAGASGNPARTPAVVVDSINNIYIAFEFRLVVDFDPGTEMDVHVSNGSSDCFLTKYHPDGNYLWTVTWGGLYDDHPDSMEIDRFDNIYMVGCYDDIVDFDPGPEEDFHQPTYNFGAFLTRFNTSGVFQWVAVWDDDMGYSIATDFNGNIYLVDNIDYSYDPDVFTIDFDPGPKTRFCEYPIPVLTAPAYLLKMPYGFNWW